MNSSRTKTTARVIDNLSLALKPMVQTTAIQMMYVTNGTTMNVVLKPLGKSGGLSVPSGLEFERLQIGIAQKVCSACE
jgi:hypothetical protein